MNKESKKMTFKDAFQELEEINEWFQQEDIDLDEGLEKFKRGMELVRLCKEKLKEIDNKFHDIKKEFSQ